ncbi:uncharacterized protein LOC129594008 [Paramacrobiotus metropolitanus]|uniref:uncharacterized protein LOC129594008 n=1 Tax=Paramacrobiotus metropolitanus TaxID=2943436 RepID=UPI00244567BB|nr:uncharacterized protein LOC129594008 [Paramacrobiotus metropolitanus]
MPVTNLPRRFKPAPKMPVHSVDVLGEDGLFRYGRVVDVADNGLFVDFCCAGRRRELVPFDKVFLTTYRPLNGNELAKIYAAPETVLSVDVRWRHSLADPWIWFPAELVNLTRGVQHVTYDAAVVRWWNTVACTDIVPVERIRRSVISSDSSTGGFSNATKRVPVSPRTFVKGSAPLPPRYISLAPAAAENLVKELNCLKHLWADQFRSVLVVEVKDGQLFYLEQRSSEKERAAEGPCFDDCWTHFGTDCTFDADDKDMEESVTDGPGTWTTDEGDIGALTTNVLLEIFSHLTAIVQNSLRRVCTAWDYIMDLITCISMRPHKFDQAHSSVHHDYFLTAPIFKCLRASTKFIVVDCRKWEMGGDVFLKVFEMIHYVAQHHGSIFLNTIVLVGLKGSMLGVSTACDTHHTGQRQEVEPSSFHAGKENAQAAGHVCLHDFTVACRDLPCNALLFLDCEFRLQLSRVYTAMWFSIDRSFSVPSIESKISRARMQRRRDYDLGCCIWDALEAGLPVATEDQLQRLSQRCAAIHAGQVPEHYIQWFYSVLCATQSGDPRPGSRWYEKKWCADGLADLRLGNLSRIALLSLVKLAGCFSPVV